MEDHRLRPSAPQPRGGGAHTGGAAPLRRLHARGQLDLTPPRSGPLEGWMHRDGPRAQRDARKVASTGASALQRREWPSRMRMPHWPDFFSFARYGLPPGRRAAVTVSAPCLGAECAARLHQHAAFIRMRPCSRASLEKRQPEETGTPTGSARPRRAGSDNKQRGPTVSRPTRVFATHVHIGLVSPPNDAPHQRAGGAGGQSLSSRNARATRARAPRKSVECS